MADDLLAGLAARIGRLEAESAVRRCLADYMDLCDRLDGATDLSALGALFTREAVWEGGGPRYDEAFGRHRGREAIVAWLRSFCTQPPHFAMNAHFLTSETVEVSSGERAHGRWLMLQTPQFHDGRCFLMAARLDIDFALEEGAWRMARFRTTNLYARAIAHWNEDITIPAPPGPPPTTGAK